MQINDRCLPCLVNQAVRVAELTGTQDRHGLYRKFFACLAEADFTKSNPELLGEFFAIVKEHLGNADPYREMKLHYDRVFLELLPEFTRRIERARDPFREAVKYAAVGNLIDFSPIHAITQEEVFAAIEKLSEKELVPDDSGALLEDVRRAKRILYIGDNCGEIALDRLLVERMRAEKPTAQIAFAVRGEAIVNDALTEDAIAVGMDELAQIVSNGDRSQGTVLPRVSEEFREIYDAADVIVSKGQANFESLSEEKGNVYFLMMVKCAVIAGYTGVPEGSMVCMRRR
ncbi:MAG: ARMT1-like domain-containing protein [Eubacteriales bacterium]|nr:ARMT1-like domain-containing protein [Eubacteriales bacterium]